MSLYIHPRVVYLGADDHELAIAKIEEWMDGASDHQVTVSSESDAVTVLAGGVCGYPAALEEVRRWMAEMVAVSKVTYDLSIWSDCVELRNRLDADFEIGGYRAHSSRRGTYRVTGKAGMPVADMMVSEDGWLVESTATKPDGSRFYRGGPHNSVEEAVRTLLDEANYLTQSS